MNPQLLLDHLGGIAHGTTLQKNGVSRPRLTQAVRKGEVERLRPGLYAAVGADQEARDAALHGGALTCAAALRAHGIWVLTDDARPHVWVGRRGRVHEHSGCRCVSHFFRGEVPVGLVDVETALAHLHRCEGDESFFASLESALRLRKLSRAARLRLRGSLPAYARWLVDFARDDADSGLESILRLRLHFIGLMLATQVMLVGVGIVDFVIDGRLILEVDGKANHDGGSKRHKDLVRDAAASALGYETLRFDYAQIIFDWPTVRAAILAGIVRVREHA
ncbi:very-short-patch-repair endonuclease [Microbacterium sp. ZKA21]|uniref:DUF559 domain-containing protein n=1 Tax=Microbacterium sp. ZKA21 TaxID=3381694 RepID=UPI003D20DA23